MIPERNLETIAHDFVTMIPSRSYARSSYSRRETLWHREQKSRPLSFYWQPVGKNLIADFSDLPRQIIDFLESRSGELASRPVKVEKRGYQWIRICFIVIVEQSFVQSSIVDRATERRSLCL